MTTAALAMLVDEGKLRWDDKVIDHLPELRLYDPYVTRELTVRDLLTHRTGLPNTDLLWAVRDDITRIPEMMRRAALRAAGQLVPLHLAVPERRVRIGGRARRADLGDAVGDVRAHADLHAARHAGDGAARLRYRGQARTSPRRTRRSATPCAWSPIRSTDAVAPAGSVWSSVSDMSRWMRFMLDSGRVGDPAADQAGHLQRDRRAADPRAEQQYPALDARAAALLQLRAGVVRAGLPRARRCAMHTGSIDGMSAIIGLLPDRRVGVYVLANLDHAELRHALMYQLFDLYGGANAPRDWSADLRTLFAARRRVPRPTPARAAGTRPVAAAGALRGHLHRLDLRLRPGDAGRRGAARTVREGRPRDAGALGARLLPQQAGRGRRSDDADLPARRFGIGERAQDVRGQFRTGPSRTLILVTLDGPLDDERDPRRGSGRSADADGIHVWSEACSVLRSACHGERKRRETQGNAERTTENGKLPTWIPSPFRELSFGP